MVDVDALVERARGDGLGEVDCLILRDLVVNGSGHPGFLSPAEIREGLRAGWAGQIPSDPEVVEAIVSQVFDALFVET